ncbi:Ubiquitin fusion degradation protein UFD1 [Fragilaria crotonensis]|nr:Ubiquitin fusion degradation protein UFD1 [Fragilaria crotonensis]
MITMIRVSVVGCLLMLGTTSVSGSTSSDPILSLQSSLTKMLKNRLAVASELASLEQRVEDFNARWVASSASPSMASSRRRLICMPLDERFDPPMGVFSHNHVQTGDKMSVPRVFWNAIELNKAEVPWLMQVTRVEDDDYRINSSGSGSSSILKERNDEDEDEDDDDDEVTGVSTSTTATTTTTTILPRVAGGPLDFRAPMNYCFLPWWMMRALGLDPRDVVDVKLLLNTILPGSAAQLRPHSSEFAKDIANPQAVLETELKHYSSLTRGSVIAFDYNGKRYWFDVVELRSAPRGEKCDMVRVQDCDIATDFLPAKDAKKAAAAAAKHHRKKP